jgi:hypothetical protein
MCTPHVKKEAIFERRKLVTITGSPIAVGVFQDEPDLL